MGQAVSGMSAGLGQVSGALGGAGAWVQAAAGKPGGREGGYVPEAPSLTGREGRKHDAGLA